MSGRRVIVPFRPRCTRRDDINRQVASWKVSAHAGDEWASSARGVLEEQGPVFGAFAAYLGSRIDLFPAMDCRELARADRRGRATPAPMVESLVSTELAKMGARHVALDRVPISVSTTTQVHHARLPDGAVVHLHIHTASFDESNEDLELLPLAEPLFAGRVGSPALMSAIDDFRARFHQDADFVALAAVLIEGAHDVDRGAPMLLPRPVPRLCSARVLVTDRPGAARDDPFVETDPWSSQTAREPSLVQAWLHQALLGSVCPVVAPDERIEQCGDRFVVASAVRLPKSTQQHLVSHMFAVAGEWPDRAWAALQPELVAVRQASPAEHVLREFRRLVPFRDDRRTETGSRVADQTFLQWRLASQHGWLPAPHVVPFYRGLFGAMCAAPAAAHGEDALTAAISALRIPSDVRQAGAWMADADVLSTVERQMALLIELPQKLDRLLTVAADGAVRVQLVPADAAATSQRNRIATAVALLLVAASLIVMAGAWPAVRQLWASEPWRSLALVVAGAVLVWTVGRLR